MLSHAVFVVVFVVVVSRCSAAAAAAVAGLFLVLVVEKCRDAGEIFLDFPSRPHLSPHSLASKEKRKKKQSRMSLSLAASWCVSSSSSSSSSCSVTIAHFRSFFHPRLFCESMAREFSLLRFYFAVKFRTSSRPREMDISFFRLSACS